MLILFAVRYFFFPGKYFVILHFSDQRYFTMFDSGDILVFLGSTLITVAK